MMSSSSVSVLCVLFLASGGVTHAQELYSDVTISSIDESKALEIKADQFWNGVLAVAESTKVAEHAETLERVEKVIASLPAENHHVAGLLKDAVERLQRAGRTVFKQRLAAEKLSLDSIANQGSDPGSLEASGFGVFNAAVRRFVTGEGTHKQAGMYPERLQKQVLDRQDKILPTLQGYAQELGNVLDDCRLATKASFDVRKYDIYHRKEGVPNTPKEADDAAEELVKVSGEIRKSYTSLIVGMVKSIADDTAGKTERPQVTVVKSALAKQKNFLRGPENNGEPAPEENLINL